MAEHVIIDGNNLLFAMHAHAPIANVGRETLAKIVGRWADRTGCRVTLVFDGPQPAGGLAGQMESAAVAVRFSAPHSADDVIVEMIGRVEHPSQVRVVTGDTAIRHVARRRRCLHQESADFVADLFPPPVRQEPGRAPVDEKPRGDPARTGDWLDAFGYDSSQTEPFDGHDAMDT